MTAVDEPGRTWSGHSTIAHNGTPPQVNPVDIRERSYLVVFTSESSFMFNLPTTGDVRIGRARDIELRIDDHSVSRKHTLLRVIDGQVRVKDLGSQNGTFVNGEKLAGSRTLLSEDVISIGGTSLVFHENSRIQPASVALEVDAFRAAVEEEVERAQTSGRSFAILAVGRPDTPLSRRVSETLLGQLRRIDRVTRVASQSVFVLLPEVEDTLAPEIAQRLLGAVRAQGLTLRAGYALYPRDGTRSGTLMASARSAMETAEDGSVSSAREAFHLEQLGEQTALMADESMIRLYQLLRRLANSDLPVLVVGETGTGKELAASAIHYFSSRKQALLVTLNCAAMQETLIESELFGHERGAFSGAVAAKPGLLEIGDGGTVFLDEVGELPLAAQAKLLRALEYKRFTRVGGMREQQVDVRFVAATNRDLAGEVEQGRFRADLYYRLNAATVCIPPLRDRRREVHILAQRFLDDACERMARGPMSISSDALQMLVHHDWPGNVRELKNTVDYLAATALDDSIDVDAVHEYLSRAGSAEVPVEAPREPTPSAPDQPAPESAHLQQPAEFRPLKEEIRELERTRISQALTAESGNQTRAAKLISMPLRTFIEKAKKYGILGRKS